MHVKKAVPFSRTRWVAYIASMVVILAGAVATAAMGGFNLGIDFKPGLSETVQLSAVHPIDTVREALKGTVKAADGTVHEFTVQPVGQGGDKFQLRTVAFASESNNANLQEEMSNKGKAALEGKFGAGSVTILGSEFINPTLSNELVVQTTWIALAAVLVILLYIWFRFKFAYALAAIIGLVHDPIVVLGVVGTMQMEVTTATIAVVLTIIGYSMNDKIVVFDRIRENLRLKQGMNFYDLVDLSITETLSRTIVSSFTVVLSMVAVYVFTQGSIRDFALALIIGVVVATYSSIFISAPLMVALSGGKPPKEKERKAVPEDGVEA